MARFKQCLQPLMLGVAAVALLGVAPAASQYYPAPYGYSPAPPPQPILSPQHADAIVRSLGLTPLGRALPHGAMFIVPAIGQEGTQVQVTLDRRTGQVVQIARVGRITPRVATLPPGASPESFDTGNGDPGFFDDDQDLPPPRARGRGLPGNEPAGPTGPAVITREGIQSESLPPLGSGRRQAERGPDVTGGVPVDPYIPESTPRSGGPGSLDPLLGVPKEFRGQPQRNAAPQRRTAAHAPAASIPHAAPMPRPRPADAPTVAQNETANEPAATSAAKEPALPSKTKTGAEKLPPVQPLE
jgi:hypothetical protein